MTSREFAAKWVQQRGLTDPDSDYDGWLGKCVLAVWNFIAEQGHSGSSAAMLFAALEGIRRDYDNSKSPIWKAYWESDEGRAQIASVCQSREQADSLLLTLTQEEQ